MSLDSLVGAGIRHTATAIAHVKSVVASPIQDDRLRLLMRVRGAFLHGAAPDVYESEHYEEYYHDHEADPIRDLELVAARCLRESIFGSSMVTHPDPNAKLIARMQAEGRMPSRMDEECILSEHA